MRPHPKQAEVACHREQEQRHGENQAGDEHPLLVADFCSTRLGFGILGFTSHLQRLKPGTRNRLADFGLAHDRRDIGYAGFLGRQRDLRFDHAFELAQGALQPAGIVVVSQPFDDQVGIASGDAIAGVFDATGQCLKVYLRRVERHRGALRREIDDCVFHACLFLQIALDGCHAVRAGHAGDG